MTKRTLLLLTSAIMFASCGGTQQTSQINQIVLDDPSQWEPVAKISVSQFTTSAEEIIRLETADSCLIGEVMNICEAGDDFFVNANGRVYRFDKTGKYLNPIGRSGRAANEYLYIQDVEIDPQTDEIYVMDRDGNKMLIYDFDGKHKRSFDLMGNYSLTGFELLGNQILFLSSANAVNPELYVCNMDGSAVEQISTPERVMGSEGFMGATFVFGKADKRLLYHYFNDTIYQIQGNKLIPDHIVKLSDVTYKYPEIDFSNGMPANADGPRTQLMNVVKAGDYTLINHGTKWAIYNEDHSVFYPSVELVNEGNPALSPFKGKIFKGVADQDMLVVINSSELLEAGLDVKENDNPIIVKYKFK